MCYESPEEGGKKGYSLFLSLSYGTEVSKVTNESMNWFLWVIIHRTQEEFNNDMEHHVAETNQIDIGLKSTPPMEARQFWSINPRN
jgi:hypothetical protein